MTPETWNRIAYLLKEGPVSNAEVARRLRVDKRAVAGVRADLGLPVYAPPVAKQWTREDFEALTVPLRGGHCRWRGRFQQDGTPVANRKLTAYRLSFRLHHDREPVGRVLGTCRFKRCVAGAHLADHVVRAAKADEPVFTELPAGATWRGMDLVAIRRCLRGPAPWPELSLHEARFAFRFSNPNMPASELSRRLGLCATTVERYRNKGVPS